MCTISLKLFYHCYFTFFCITDCSIANSINTFSYRFKQSRFFRSHKLFVTLSSVAIASKWDEPEKIKVFIVSTVGRKVLQSRKGERHNCIVWCNTGCSWKGETHYVQLPRRNTVTRNLGYLKSFNV